MKPRKPKYKELRVLTPEQQKQLHDRDPLAYLEMMAKGKMTILEEGQEVELLKEEGDRVLIRPHGSDKAYWMSREDIQEL